MIQKVNINAVSIVSSADRCDSAEGSRGLAPAAPSHTAAVIDQENGVELRQEGVR